MSQSLLSIASEVATEAGRMIVDRRDGAEVATTKSSSVDIVTQVDTAAEELIRQRLRQLRPDDAVHGEEGDNTGGDSGITWVVDPIDGTVNYLYGLPHYAVSIATVSGPPIPGQWTVEAAAIYDGSGRLWTAERGSGAWCDDQRLAREDSPDLEHTLLATGFQYQADRRARQGEIVTAMLPRVRDIRRLGAAAVDLCHVAAGTVDAYYEHGLNAWDFAAGELIATEAGVKVAGIDGDGATERLLIAAPPGLWNDLRAALVDAGAEISWERADD